MKRKNKIIIVNLFLIFIVLTILVFVILDIYKENKIGKSNYDVQGVSTSVNNKEEKPQEKVVEEKVEEKPKNISLFTIADDDNLELPSLKKDEKKDGPSIDNITGETYNINR